MAFTVAQIDHVEVFVRDLEKAAKWYLETLGLQEIQRWQPEPIMIGAGSTKLALFKARGDVPKTPGVRQAQPAFRWHRVAWKTDKEGFEQAQAHLNELGVKFGGPVDHQVAWSIYFDDPDGNPLEITYYL